MDKFWLNFDPIDSYKRKRRATAANAESSSPQKTTIVSFPFTRLPTELQIHVLSFTDLVPESEKAHADSGVELQLSGERLRLRRPYAVQDGDGLFMTSKAVRMVAIDILLSNNRLILLDCNCELPNPGCALQCLQMLSPGVLRQAAQLEVRLKAPWLIDAIEIGDEDKDDGTTTGGNSGKEIRSCNSNDDSTGDIINNRSVSMPNSKQQSFRRFAKEWDALMGFVASSFTLPRLAVTVDAAWEYDAIAENGVSSARLAKYRAFYGALARPMQHLRGLADLRVFLACNFDCEEAIVTSVMQPENEREGVREGAWE